MIALMFEYQNWRGDTHTYLVTPERFEEADYDALSGERHWVLHANVIERDNAPRPGRRTFQLTGVRNLREVEES